MNAFEQALAENVEDGEDTVTVRSALDRVRALHAYDADADYCVVCSNHGDIQWPCRTIAVLEEQAGGAGKDTATGDESTRADFFQTGRTYSDGSIYTAPECLTLFRVEHVARHPEDGHRRAIGWMRSGTPGSKWHGNYQDSFTGWSETSEGGDAR